MLEDPTRVPEIQRQEIMTALRMGAVPARGLEHFAVGLDRFAAALDDERQHVALGHGMFKAVRGEYGSGKTFFSRWLQRRAQRDGFATTEVQVSETETPLHKLETVYRRAMENLRTQDCPQGAFRHIVENWFYSLEEEVLGEGRAREDDELGLAQAVGDLLEARLAGVSATQPQFAMALRAWHAARMRRDHATSEGLMAWLTGQPHVSATIKRTAGLKGDVDHDGAMGFLRGVLALLEQTGRRGLVLVLDEVETIQRMRADTREKSLNALRQLVDDLKNDRFPRLWVVITGTPSFYTGPHGIRRLQPLEERLHVDFSGNPKFDNPRAVQIRLAPFDLDRLIEVGRRVRDLYPTKHSERMRTRVTDEVLGHLARGVAGALGGKVGVAPRLFLRKLVGDLLDKVDLYEDFDPLVDFKPVVSGAEMNDAERGAAAHPTSAGDIDLDLRLDQNDEEPDQP
jgi:hypothetical protein